MQNQEFFKNQDLPSGANTQERAICYNNTIAWKTGGTSPFQEMTFERHWKCDRRYFSK